MRGHNILLSEPSHIALIEDIIESSEHGPSSSQVVLDCITFNAARSLKNKTWSTIEVDNEALTNTLLLSVSRHELQRVISFEPDQEQWISFSLQKAGTNTTHNERSITATFINLSGSNEEASSLTFVLSHFQKVKPPFKKLSLLAGLDSRKITIEQLLNNQMRSLEADDSPRNIIVYDIGQGSATALVDEDGCPVIFFDLGWPTSFNRHTRPNTPPDLFAGEACTLCFREKLVAPVILSHWDFDHWAYAVANDNYNYGKQAANMTFKPEAITRPWIVPKPPRIKNTKGLGPTHLRFLTALTQRIMWSNRLQRVDFLGGTLTRSDTKIAPTDRNNQGITWFVSKPGSQRVTLLPGDASFDKIRTPANLKPITGLMASHHGGKITGPIPEISPKGTLVISVGFGNLHRHPDKTILSVYAAAGWSNVLRTWDRQISTALGPQNGSILMRLAPDDSAPYFICPALVDGNLEPTQ